MSQRISVILDLNYNSELLGKLRKIFNKHDVINIYESDDVNQDEYDLEIIKAVEEFNHCFDLNKFTEKMYNIFCYTFDRGTAGLVDKYFDLSRDVYNLLKNEVESKEIVPREPTIN